MDVLHELDAFVTWQGGFDYYFAHQEELAVWDQAQSDLRKIGLLMPPTFSVSPGTCS
jgi:hypothetical protein